MRSQDLTADEIAQAGAAIYERELKRQLEPAHHGAFVAIAVEDGDYEVADSSLEATMKLRDRHPEAVFYVGRVGYRNAVTFHTPYLNVPLGKS
jgi:hypothetical protein